MQLCCILQIVLWMWAYGNYSRQTLVFFSKYADAKHGLASSTVKSRNVTKQTYLLALDYCFHYVVSQWHQILYALITPKC